MMILKLKVSDMRCGHCQRTIENAIKQTASSAVINTNLADKTVTIHLGDASKQAALVSAVKAAGYTPEILSVTVER